MGALFLARLAGALLAAGSSPVVPPLPSNVSHVFDDINCALSVKWDPVEYVGNSCKLQYHTALYTGQGWTQQEWSSALFRNVEVPLGLTKSVVFGLRTSCVNGNQELLRGEWHNISLTRKGAPGTGAANLSCVCHNTQSLLCSWTRGANAPQDTIYSLSFWQSGLERRQPCEEASRAGDIFRCTFRASCSRLNPVVLSVRGDSRDIQPLCAIMKEGRDYPIKLDPPSDVKAERGRNGVFLTWSPPISLSGMCYEVEVNNKIKEEPYEDFTNVTISLEPNKYHTFRVRAMLDRTLSHCSEKQGLWSEWSDRAYWDDQKEYNALTIVLFFLILSSVAILTILILVHLKKIHLLICPIIPDPEKVLKRMFEDQREEYQPVEHSSEFVKPNINKTDCEMNQAKNCQNVSAHNNLRK